MHNRIEDAERILVLDTIHGGRIIEEELRALGKDVVAVNPYRTHHIPSHHFDLVISPVHLSPSLFSEIVSSIMKATAQEGVHVARNVVRRAVCREWNRCATNKHELNGGEPGGDDGAAVNAMNAMNAVDTNVDVMTHHEAVREIAAATSMFDDVNAVVEVTGTTAKTTVCEIVCQLLSEKRTLSLTSAGLKFANRRLPLRLSITPASILRTMRYAVSEGLNVEYAVFEVSLGLTGVGDVGVITALNPDYKIAGNMKNASDAKLSSLKHFNGILVTHSSAENAVARAINDRIDDGITQNIASKHLRLITTTQKTSQINEIMENAIVENATAVFDLNTLAGRMSGEFALRCGSEITRSEFYHNAAEIAITAVISLGIPHDELIKTINAVEHRMNIKQFEGRTLIDNSNSGTNLRYLRHAEMLERRIREIKSNHESVERVLIVGEESEYVCEGVNADELRNLIASRYNDFSLIIVVGEKFRDVVSAYTGNSLNNISKRNGSDTKGGKIVLVKSLKEALDNAVKHTKDGAIIISNVKTWQ